MGRVFCTGDRHAVYDDIDRFCYKMSTSKKDVLIVLGDNGVNFFNDKRDDNLKRTLDKFPITFMMIKGNHDMRPSNIDGYELQHVVMPRTLSGEFWIQPEHPSLLFTKEYGAYKIKGTDAYVIGGAYSIDKDYRIQQQFWGEKDYKWFSDEELSDEEMRATEKDLEHMNPTFMLTHTCPLCHKPFDKLPGLPYEAERMERWLDKFVDMSYKVWLCGHWHINLYKVYDRIQFLYGTIRELKPNGKMRTII